MQSSHPEIISSLVQRDFIPPTEYIHWTRGRGQFDRGDHGSAFPHNRLLLTPLKYFGTGRIEEFLKPYSKRRQKKRRKNDGTEMPYENAKEIFTEIY